MKTTWAFLVVILLLTAPAALQAQFNYMTNSDGVSITIVGYTGSNDDVRIPTNINGLTVTGIATNGFEDSSLTNVTIPASITDISEGAFAFCGELTVIAVDTNNSEYSSVNGVLFDKSETTLIQYPRALGESYTIPGSVATVGAMAFQECNLASVTIPSSVTTIRDYAFAGCDGLTNAPTLPGVTNIGPYAFEDCLSLTSAGIPACTIMIGADAFKSCLRLRAITVDTNNPNYSSVNGVLFDKNQNTLIQYPCAIIGSYAIPDAVTSIEDYSFYASQYLTQVTIPEGVTSIPEYSFSLSGLTSVTIPGGVTNIGASAFNGCGALTNAAIPASVSAIETMAFDGCGLTSVTIPGSVISIGDSAFFLCPLTNATISSGVKSIGSAAFFGTRFNDITIPASVTTIGTNVFGLCSSLNAILVDPNNPNYSSVNGVLFDKNQTTLIQHPDADFGSYTIPSTVTSIGDYAFAYCTQISVNIPASVTTIGAYAFAFCFNWRNVTIPATVTNIGPYAFRNDSDLNGVFYGGNAPNIDPTAFYIQDPFNYGGATNYYLPGTAGWSSPIDGLPGLLWNPLIQTGDGSFGVRGNQFGFNVTGTTNIPIVVERSTSLENPVWLPLITNALADGLFYFNEPVQTNISGAFYRISAP